MGDCREREGELGPAENEENPEHRVGPKGSTYYADDGHDDPGWPSGVVGEGGSRGRFEGVHSARKNTEKGTGVIYDRVIPGKEVERQRSIGSKRYESCRGMRTENRAGSSFGETRDEERGQRAKEGGSAGADTVAERR